MLWVSSLLNSKLTHFNQIIYTLKKDVHKCKCISDMLQSLKPFCPCVFQDNQLPCVSGRSLVPFSIEMRGKQPWYTPRLCMLTLSSRERNVWMVDNYQRAKVTLLYYLNRMTIHFYLLQPVHSVCLSIHAILENLCSFHNVMSCMESVHHTHSKVISCHWQFSQYGLSHQLMGKKLFMIRVSLQ